MRYPELLNMTEQTNFQIRTSDSISSLLNMPHQQMTEFLQWHYQEANNASFIRDTDIGFSLFSMALQPIPVGLQRENFNRGPAALQTDPAHGDKLWIEYSLGWTKPLCNETCPQTLINVVDSAKFHPQEKYRGVKPTNCVSGDLSFVPYNPLFANDAQAGQPVLASYG
jgi:hypothetical protein